MLQRGEAGDGAPVAESGNLSLRNQVMCAVLQALDSKVTSRQ